MFSGPIPNDGRQVPFSTSSHLGILSNRSQVAVDQLTQGHTLYVLTKHLLIGFFSPLSVLRESVKPFSGLEHFHSPSEGAVSAVPKEGNAEMLDT